VIDIQLVVMLIVAKVEIVARRSRLTAKRRWRCRRPLPTGGRCRSSRSRFLDVIEIIIVRVDLTPFIGPRRDFGLAFTIPTATATATTTLGTIASTRGWFIPFGGRLNVEVI
jgi:hypothetical protein